MWDVQLAMSTRLNRWAALLHFWLICKEGARRARSISGMLACPAIERTPERLRRKRRRPTRSVDTRCGEPQCREGIGTAKGGIERQGVSSEKGRRPLSSAPEQP